MSQRRCSECGAFVRSPDVLISRTQTDSVSVNCMNCIRRSELAHKQIREQQLVQDILQRVRNPIFAEWFDIHGTERYVKSGGKVPQFDADAGALQQSMRNCTLCYWYELAQAKIALSKQATAGSTKQLALRQAAGQILDVLEKIPAIERNDACNACKLKYLSLQNELKESDTGGAITLDNIKQRQNFIHQFWDHVFRSADCLWCYLAFLYRDAQQRQRRDAQDKFAAQENALARAMMLQLQKTGKLTASMQQYLEGSGAVQLAQLSVPTPEVVEGWLKQVQTTQCPKCLQLCKPCAQFHKA